jgi:hypothetical protein
LIAAVIYYFLGNMGALFRVLISVGTFLILSGIFTLVILKIGDQAPPNAITITPEMLEEASKHKKD